MSGVKKYFYVCYLPHWNISISPMASSRKEELLVVTKTRFYIQCLGSRESIRTWTVWKDLLNMWESQENRRKGNCEATVLTKALFSLWRNSHGLLQSTRQESMCRISSLWREVRNSFLHMEMNINNKWTKHQHRSVLNPEDKL